MNIPVSILLGIAVGVAVGCLLLFILRYARLAHTAQVILLMGVSLGLVAAENTLQTPITFSALLSVMAMGAVLRAKAGACAARLSQGFDRLWSWGEIMLFVLVGASVSIVSLGADAPAALCAVLSALVFRAVGVLCCLLGSRLSCREKLFCVLAYLPKATVQAAIGGLPLAMGLSCGEIVLTVAVLSILVTAPPGAICIDQTYKRLLDGSEKGESDGKIIQNEV